VGGGGTTVSSKEDREMLKTARGGSQTTTKGGNKMAGFLRRWGTGKRPMRSMVGCLLKKLERNFLGVPITTPTTDKIIKKNECFYEN